MTKFSILLATFFSISAFASTHGGGVLSRTVGGQVTAPGGIGELQSEWVKYKGMDQNEVVFEYGQKTRTGDLFTREYKQRAEEFSQEQGTVLNAIHESQIKNDWVQIQH